MKSLTQRIKSSSLLPDWLRSLWRWLPPRDKRYLLQDLETPAARESFISSSAYAHFQKIEAAHWSQPAKDSAGAAAGGGQAASGLSAFQYVLAHPLVRAELDRRTRVDGVWNFLRRHGPFESVCLLGAGYGEHARLLGELGIARQITALDIAQAYGARPEPFRVGEATLRLQYCDLNRPRFSAQYDLFLALHSIHHIFNLELLFAAIADHLKPGGRFVFEEYVGPNYLECPQSVRPVLRDIYARLVPGPYQLGAQPAFKSRWHVQRDSPFESIRSAAIHAALLARFPQATFQPLGGCLVQEILAQILPRLTGEEHERQFIVELLDLDEALTTQGTLPNYFAFGCAQI